MRQSWILRISTVVDFPVVVQRPVQPADHINSSVLLNTVIDVPVAQGVQVVALCPSFVGSSAARCSRAGFAGDGACCGVFFDWRQGQFFFLASEGQSSFRSHSASVLYSFAVSMLNPVGVDFLGPCAQVHGRGGVMLTGCGLP